MCILQAYQYHFDSYRYFPSNLDVIDWLGSYFIEMQVRSAIRVRPLCFGSSRGYWLSLVLPRYSGQ